MEPVKLAAMPLWVNTPSSVDCGFPSPADDFQVERIDMAKLLCMGPDDFVIRAAGFSMVGAGIDPDDLMVVKKTDRAKERAIVIAVVDGSFTCKYACFKGGFHLEAANPLFPAIWPREGQEVTIWGVVKRIIKSV